jgi:hypothetical protein
MSPPCKPRRNPSSRIGSRIQRCSVPRRASGDHGRLDSTSPEYQKSPSGPAPRFLGTSRLLAMPLRSRCFPTGRQPELECFEVCSQGWNRFFGSLIDLLDGSEENPISVQKHKRGTCRRGSPGLCQPLQEPTGDSIGGLRWSYGIEDALACHPSGSHGSLPRVPTTPDATSIPDATSTLAIRIRFVLLNVCRGDRFAKRKVVRVVIDLENERLQGSRIDLPVGLE